MKMKLLFTVLALGCSILSIAQKSSNTTLTLQFTIQPGATLPEQNVTYHSTISTPLDPLSEEETMTATAGIKDEAQKKVALENAKKAKLNDMAKKALSISGAKFIAAESNVDWAISLVTSDVKLISTNEKPVSELSMNDPIFTYTCSAVLTVKDKSGKILLEKVIQDPNAEQKMPKAVLFLNLTYKMKVSMARNNPEKLKKLNDQMLEKKNYLIFLLLMEKADKALTDAYEVQEKTINVSVFSVKGKPYEDLNTISDNIFETYKKFRALSKKNRIPKEDVDKVMRDAVPVWEKYYNEHKTELEEKAAKGLLLNCALATTWTGDYEKALGYFDQVPEAQKSEVNVEDSENGPSGSMGATVLLSFKQSAENVRDLYENFNEYRSRAVITQ